MRKDNRVFFGFIFLILLLFGWQGSKYVKKIFNYYSLNQEGFGEIYKREVIQKKRDRYQILVGLRYLNQGEWVEATTVLPKAFLNPWAAEKALNKMTLEKIPIYYSAKKPAFVEVKREFPTNALVSFIILAVILLYFLVLKLWFERQEKKIDDQKNENSQTVCIDG